MPTREPVAPIYGSKNFLIENYDAAEVAGLSMPDVSARLKARGADYGLVRQEGFLMHMPGIKGYGVQAHRPVTTPGAWKARGPRNFS